MEQCACCISGDQVECYMFNKTVVFCGQLDEPCMASEVAHDYLY